MLNDARVLVTGGTGSFGRAFVQHVLTNYKVGEIVVFSRDEFKQHEMAQRWPVDSFPIRYFLGDIRDKERLLRAFYGVDYVVHAAALKQVPALEENPTEAVRTNIVGAQNIIEAALERGVRRVVAISAWGRLATLGACRTGWLETSRTAFYSRDLRPTLGERTLCETGTYS